MAPTRNPLEQVNTTGHRLAIVVSHPIQYYSPWFRFLAESGHYVLKVFYLWNYGVAAHNDANFGKPVQWDVDLLSGYEFEFVPNVARDPGTRHFGGLNNPSLPARLQAFRPHSVLLFGYNYRSHLRVIWTARRRGWNLLFRGDSHLLGGAPEGPIKRLLLRVVYSRFHAFLAVGQANADYFRHFGVADHKIFRAPHAVDQSRFVANPERDAAAARERRQLGIGVEERVILFAGKFTAKKRPDLLLAAFQQARPDNLHLVFAGGGPLEDDLHAAAETHARVHFLPFANQSAMPARYLVGDVLALPSEGRYETWGLAVNEAMHLGRPALVSDVVGCHHDLITPRRTGWVFPSGDRDQLAALLREIAALPAADLRAIGDAARARAADYSFAAAADGLRRALAFLPFPS